MKIRIKGNSIRYRLSKTDISNFEKDGFIEEKTVFVNGNALIYRLEKSKGILNRTRHAHQRNVIIVVVASAVRSKLNDCGGLGGSSLEEDGCQPAHHKTLRWRECCSP